MTKFKIFGFSAWSFLLLAAVACRAAYADEAAAEKRQPITMTFQNDTIYDFTLTKYSVTGCIYYGTTNVKVPAKTTVALKGEIQSCGTADTTFAISWNFLMYDWLAVPVEWGLWTYQIKGLAVKNRSGQFITKTSDSTFGRTSIRKGRMNIYTVNCGNTLCSPRRDMTPGNVDLFVHIDWAGIKYKSMLGYANGSDLFSNHAASLK